MALIGKACAMCRIRQRRAFSQKLFGEIDPTVL
jgi:hypothetical protein